MPKIINKQYKEKQEKCSQCGKKTETIILTTKKGAQRGKKTGIIILKKNENVLNVAE